MSEGIHSPSETMPVSSTAPAQGRPWRAILGGTAAVGVGAAILFQVLRPEQAASQTAEKPKPRASAQASPPAAGSLQQMARVNNQTISYDAVAKECINRHGAEVLDSMIHRLVIQQECDRQGVTISEAEVDQEVASIAKKFNLQVEQWYSILGAERKVTPEQYRKDAIWPMLALRKLAGIKAESKVTEDDMLKAFERDYGPRVKVRMILVQGNVRQAGEIWEKCKAAPDKFEDLAAEFSADSQTRPLGGAMPPIRRHGGLTKIEEQAFKMKDGDISPVIPINDNEHMILKCEGRTEQVVTNPKDVWDELFAQVSEEKTQLAVAETFQGIQEKADIHNFLTNISVAPKKPAPQGTPVRQASGTRTKPTSKPGQAELP